MEKLSVIYCLALSSLSAWDFNTAIFYRQHHDDLIISEYHFIFVPFHFNWNIFFSSTELLFVHIILPVGKRRRTIEENDDETTIIMCEVCAWIGQLETSFTKLNIFNYKKKVIILSNPFKV